MAYNKRSPLNEDNHPDRRYWDGGKTEQSFVRDFPGAFERWNEHGGFGPRNSDSFRFRVLLAETAARAVEAGKSLDVDEFQPGDELIPAITSLDFGRVLDVIQEFLRIKLGDPKYVLPADIVQNRQLQDLIETERKAVEARARTGFRKKLPIVIELGVGTLTISEISRSGHATEDVYMGFEKKK